MHWNNSNDDDKVTHKSKRIVVWNSYNIDECTSHICRDFRKKKHKEDFANINNDYKSKFH